MRYAIDSTRLRTELGWQPTYADFEAGLTKTIEWYVDHESWWRPHKDDVELHAMSPTAATSAPPVGVVDGVGEGVGVGGTGPAASGALPRLRELARSDDAPEPTRRHAKELRDGIKAKVKQAGLWAPHLPDEYGGAGLGFLEHAYMNEVLAYCMGAAALFGVVAPNSGNQKILA